MNDLVNYLNGLSDSTRIVLYGFHRAYPEGARKKDLVFLLYHRVGSIAGKTGSGLRENTITAHAGMIDNPLLLEGVEYSLLSQMPDGRYQLSLLNLLQTLKPAGTSQEELVELQGNLLYNALPEKVRKKFRHP